MIDSLIWAAVLPACMSALDAQYQLEKAEHDLWMHQEEMRNFKRAGSIEVEARWVEEVPMLEAPK